MSSLLSVILFHSTILCSPIFPRSLFNWVSICFFSSPISLTVAKCWDPSPRSYFTIPRGKTAISAILQSHGYISNFPQQIHILPSQSCLICVFCSAEPVRPIDPAAWISHTTALTGPYPHYGKNNQPPPPSHTMKHPFCGNYDNLTIFEQLKSFFLLLVKIFS